MWKLINKSNNGSKWVQNDHFRLMESYEVCSLLPTCHDNQLKQVKKQSPLIWKCHIRPSPRQFALLWFKYENGSDCFCRMGTGWCCESNSVCPVHSGTVISSICRQWEECKASEKVISGCVEVLKMRISKGCKGGLGGWWEREFKIQEDYVCRPTVCTKSIIMLECTLAWSFYFHAFHRLFDNFGVLVWLILTALKIAARLQSICSNAQK